MLLLLWDRGCLFYSNKSRPFLCLYKLQFHIKSEIELSLLDIWTSQQNIHTSILRTLQPDLLPRFTLILIILIDNFFVLNTNHFLKTTSNTTGFQSFSTANSNNWRKNRCQTYMCFKTAKKIKLTQKFRFNSTNC